MSRELLVKIVREWRLSVTFILLLLFANAGALYYQAFHQSPALALLQEKWNDLRRKQAAADRRDAGTIYRQALNDLNSLKERVPRKREFPRLLGDIFESASASSVVTGAVTYKPQSVPNQNLIAYTISLSVSGSYAEVKSFLGDIQRNKELLVIDSIALSNKDLYEEYVTLDMKLTTYLRDGSP